MIGQKKVLTATGAVSKQRGGYFGYTVSVVTATAAIVITDSLDATGTVLDTIPIGTAAGTQHVLPASIRCDTGIFCKFGSSDTATGTILFLYD